MTKAKESPKKATTDTSEERPPWMKTKVVEISQKEQLRVEYGLVANHLWMSVVLWKVEKNQWSRVGIVPVEQVKKHDAQLGRLVDFFGLVKREGKAWIALCRELNLT
jgi:hypothetical protein